MAKDKANMTSIGKALILVDTLAAANGSLSLKELSERTGWAKSTVHGLLSALRDFRIIMQDDDGRYRLGTHLFELGNAVSRQWNIVEIAKPVLQSVCTKLNESVCIATLDGDSMLVLDSIAAYSPMRVITDIGSRLPLHATAIGKAFLAGMPPDETTKLLKRIGMASYTPHTITDVPSILAERDVILKKGYAIENGEMRVGIRAVAAPIYDINDCVKYAISVTGMFRKITDETFYSAQELVISAASEITKKLHQ